MIEERKVSILSHLIASLKEAVFEMEKVIEQKNESRFLMIKDHVIKLNDEISENLV